MTDNDNDHEEEEQQQETDSNTIKIHPIVDVKQSPQSDNGFDICSNDDEIEESPIKTELQLLVVDRNKFVLDYLL